MEMAQASGVDIRITAFKPARGGAQEMLPPASEHPAFRQCRDCRSRQWSSPDLLFDPNTAGGLLGGVPAGRKCKPH